MCKGKPSKGGCVLSFSSPCPLGEGDVETLTTTTLETGATLETGSTPETSATLETGATIPP